jgi:hypothetical protein
VKWKGYDEGQNSWSPHYNVFAPEAVQEFHRLNPGAPRQINAASFDYISFGQAERSSNWRLRRGVTP